MRATQKQRELLARLNTEAGLPRKPDDFESLDSVKAHIWIDELLAEKKAKKRDYSEYFALEKHLIAIGYDLTREDIVYLFSEGKYSGLRQLSNREYYSLLKFLRDKVKENEDPTLPQMRSKIIALFHKMGWEMEAGQADMKAIYKWTKKYGKFHKPLNLHTKQELTELTTQVKLMYDKHLEEVHK